MLDRNGMQFPASPMVHIEANGTDPLTTTPGNHTFYGTMLGASAADNREPLGAMWDARVYASFGLGGLNNTEFVVWRDRGSAAQMNSGTNCGALPPPFPLYQTQVALFDESEQVVGLDSPPPPPNPPPPPPSPPPPLPPPVS